MTRSEPRANRFCAAFPATTALLLGCAPAKYSPPANETFAYLNMGEFTSMEMCKAGKRYTLVAENAAQTSATSAACDSESDRRPKRSRSKASDNALARFKKCLEAPTKINRSEKPAEPNRARIPAGERVTVGWFMSWERLHEYREFCGAWLSFVPKAGGHYAADFGVVGPGCYAEVVQEAPERLTGVAPEPSIGPPHCR
jgi:hypothetical protein